MMHFEHVSQEKMGIVKKWLDEPHVREYFFGSGLDVTLKSLEAFVNHEKTLFTHWLAYFNKTPFGYLLTSEVDNNEELFSQFCSTNTNAITLDLLIGEKEFLGKGLSHLMIEALLEQKFPNVTDVFIDPDKKNLKAIHVYEKAGFQQLVEFVPEWNPIPHVLMRLHKKSS